MNKWKKILLVVINIVAIALFVEAEELPPKTWARMDVDGISEGIKLTPVKEEVSKGVTFFNQYWRKENDFCLTSRVFFKEDVWRHVKLAFKANKSGEVKLGLNGAYRAKPEFEKLGYPSFKYCNIKVDGKTIAPDDKSWVLKNESKVISTKGPKGKNIKCIKAKCQSPAYYTINVEKNKTVIVEFDVKYDGSTASKSSAK